MTSLTELLKAAIQHYQRDQWQAVEHLCQQVLQQQPGQANALYLLGLAAHRQQQLPQAIGFYQQAVASQPDYAEAHNNLGVALQQHGQWQAAIAHYHQALRLQPSNPHAHLNLGAIFQQQGKLEAAIARYQKVLSLVPDSPDAHRNLAHALKQKGDLLTASAHYQRVLDLVPQDPDAYRDLGDALQEQGDLAGAIAIYDRALQQFPDYTTLQGSRIRALLVGGDLLAGFAAYDPWRLALGGRSFSQPIWDGTPLRGQPILLYREPGVGFGDSIQFVRYAPLVAEQGGRVIVECSTPLQRLFQTIPAIDQIIPAGQPLPEFAVQASLLSLPRILGTTLDTIPAAVPYLTSVVDRPLPATLGLKIGLVWGGDPNHLHDKERSCPLAQFQPVLQVPGVSFYSLQKGAHAAELAEAGLEIIDLGDRLQDFADTAGAIAQLDLIISVDTAVAHLAGALGKPVWILLNTYADWRWLLGRSDSPWYPTARLFRQTRQGGWAGVCQEVTNALQAVVARTGTDYLV
jgi:tetratricopeptide (TPR) repeat protein